MTTIAAGLKYSIFYAFVDVVSEKEKERDGERERERERAREKKREKKTQKMRVCACTYSLHAQNRQEE